MSFISNDVKVVKPKPYRGQKITIIGEALGTVEEREGEYFKGPAGGILEQCLHAAGILRSQVHILNVFKFRIIKKRRGTKSDIYHKDGTLLWHADKGFTEAAEPYLKELNIELEKAKETNVYVPMGNPALEAITGKRLIYRQRGSILECIRPTPESRTKPAKAVPTIHPAATLQSGDYLARYYIIFDLKRVKEESRSKLIKLPRQTFIIQPTYDEVLSNLKDYFLLGKRGKRINYDIEIINQEVSAISFAADHHRAISVPFDTRWNKEQEVEIWKAVARIIEDERIGTCNQNVLFDSDSLLFRNKIVSAGRFDDPMSAINIVYPDFPKALEFTTSIYTRIPYYKDEGKIWFKGMGTDIEAFYRYSCQDSAVSIEVMDQLDKELDSKGHRETYERTMAIYPACAAMMARGIRADKEKLLKVKREMEKTRDEKQELLNQMCGRELNVKSTKQKKEYFYIEKGITPYKKNGRPTTDEKAMVRLAKGTATRQPIPEAQLVVEITKIRSQLEKYMEVELDADGRLRCQINPWGTTTGRLSTGKRLITNSGLNMQNLTEDFKKFLFADSGYALIEIDKKQGEWVVVAYFGGDARMIEVVEEKKDAHAITGSLITGIKDIALIKAEAKSLSHETNPDNLEETRQCEFPELIRHREAGGYLPRHMTVRQLGKKSNHGGNYGMGYKRCAAEWEIPEHEAKKILPLYHQAYPGVQNGFQDGIIRQLSNNRTVTNCFGRKRQFLDRIDWKRRTTKVFYDAFGFLPQSTIGDLMLRGMDLIYRDQEGPMPKLEFLMQVHDSLLFQYPVHLFNQTYEDMATAVLRCCEHLNPTMTYSGRDFQIENELKVGYCWGEMDEVKLSDDKDVLANRIKEVLGDRQYKTEATG